MKKFCFFLLLSLNIICWEAKAMERGEENTSKGKAEEALKNARKEEEIEEAIRASNYLPGNPALNNQLEVEKVESVVEVSIFEDTPSVRPPIDPSNGAPQDHLNLLNAGIKKLQEQYPEEQELMQFLISYRDEFDIRATEAASVEASLEPTKTSFPPDFSCIRNAIEWEQETLKQLLAESPEITLAHKSLKIATCYRNSIASKKEYHDYMKQADAAIHTYEKVKLIRIAFCFENLHYVFWDQARALKEAFEARKEDFQVDELFTQAADEFQESSKHYRNSVKDLLTGNEREVEKQSMLAHKRKISGDALIKQARALKKARKTSGLRPAEISNI